MLPTKHRQSMISQATCTIKDASGDSRIRDLPHSRVNLPHDSGHGTQANKRPEVRPVLRDRSTRGTYSGGELLPSITTQIVLILGRSNCHQSTNETLTDASLIEHPILLGLAERSEFPSSR